VFVSCFIFWEFYLLLLLLRRLLFVLAVVVEGAVVVVVIVVSSCLGVREATDDPIEEDILLSLK